MVFGLFFPFMVYLVLFCVYCTYSIEIKARAGTDERFGKAYTLNFALSTCIFLLIIYFGFVEVNQVIFHKIHYFTSMWNLIDLCSLVLNLLVVIFDLTETVAMEDMYNVLCVAVLIMYLKTFYFLRIFTSTASLIRMISEITYNMKYFAMVLVLACVGFGNCFLILARNATDFDFSGGSLWRSVIFAYKIGLGDFTTKGFETQDEVVI